MFILGLTGSIGMGKSTTADMFRRLRKPVHDADAVVHRLLGPGGAAVKPIGEQFKDVTGPNGVDRQKLGAVVFDNPEALDRLEMILHPMVRQSETDFLKRQSRAGATLVVLDIPLLFETEGEKRMDAVAVVTAPSFVQRQRVMARPGMTAEKFSTIVAKQIPDRDKRFLADFIIHTGLGHCRAFDDIRAILDQISGLPGQHWPRRPMHFQA